MGAPTDRSDSKSTAATESSCRAAPLRASGLAATEPGAGDEGESAVPIDGDALLVALVLVPTSYARNRFEPLYRVPAVRQVRGRAAMVRSIVCDLTCGVAAQRAELGDLEVHANGETRLRYEVPPLGLRRESRLSRLELELVQHLVARIESISAAGGRWRMARGLDRLGRSGPSQSEGLRRALAGLFWEC